MDAEDDESRFGTMKKIRNIQEAVREAKKKNQAGFAWLYEKTWREKYYIALKYMKNEAAAEDVLQDAYIKAWERIDSLEDAEKYSAWLGQIVAHTALDALKKKKPLLFSEISNEDEDGEGFFFDREDEKNEKQPELAFTDKEREEILRSMINTLSDEQRFCILMYYVEELSVKEIAENLGCSENTVKSRLNYGRKNIRKEAELLQKQGYEFFGLAPMPLFLYLLQMEAAEGGAALTLLGGAGATGGISGLFGNAFLGTFLGRKAVHIMSGLFAAGLLFGGYHLTQNTKQDAKDQAVESTAHKKIYPVSDSTELSSTELRSVEPSFVESGPAASEKSLEKAEESSSTESEREGLPFMLTDEEYPSLLAGDLEKEDFEILLLNAPAEMKNGELTKEQISHLIQCSVAYEMKTPPILERSFADDDPDTVGMLLLKDTVNRYLSAITDYRIEGKETAVPEIKVMGKHLYLEDYLSLSTETDGKDILWNEVEIQEVRKKGSRIFVYYKREGSEEEEVIEESGEETADEDVSIEGNGEATDEDASVAEEEEAAEEDVIAEEETVDEDSSIGGNRYTQTLYAELEQQASGKYRIVAVHPLEKVKGM